MKKLSLFLSVAFIVCLVGNVWADTLTVSGRLSLTKRGESRALILLARDATSYNITGELVAKLKSALSELGEMNLVTVTAEQDGSFSISCRNRYSFDAQGNRIIDTKCIRYYNLDVVEIIDTQKSDEKMPAPKRDVKEEKQARMSALQSQQQQALAQTQIGELKGKIRALNLRAPLKTVKIAFRDKDNKPIQKVLMLNANTRIAQKYPDSDAPMYLSIKSLRVGQEVNVVYSRDERKTEALFITILK